MNFLFKSGKPNSATFSGYLFTRHDKRRFHVRVIYSHLSCALSYSAYYLPKSASYYYLKQLGWIMQNNNNNISFGKLANGQWIKEKAQKWCSVGIDFFYWLPWLARQLHLVYSGLIVVPKMSGELDQSFIGFATLADQVSFWAQLKNIEYYHFSIQNTYRN